MSRSTSSSPVGVALITGATGHIGAAFAHQLAQRGHDLVLVARDTLQLQTLAEQLLETTGRRVDFIGADLATLDGQRHIGRMLETDARITLLLNNASVALRQPMADSNAERLSKLVQLNVGAVTYLANAAVRAFLARGRGTIINMTSVAALAPEQLNGAYVASRAFVLSLSQSLQAELAGTPLRVQVVLADEPGDAESSMPWLTSAEQVAQALQGLDRGDRVTIPTLEDRADWDRFESARRVLAFASSIAALE